MRNYDKKLKISSVKLDEETIRITKILKSKFNERSANSTIKRCLEYFYLNDVTPDDKTRSIESVVISSKNSLLNDLTNLIRKHEVRLMLDGFKELSKKIDKLSTIETKENNNKLEEISVLINELDNFKKMKNLNGENSYFFALSDYNEKMDKLKFLIRK